jgi:succinate dehydrogenase cytochrome b subunit
MNKQRPINLDLMTMKFPPMAIASFLHRVSGIVLFLFIPGMLYLLSESLASPVDFRALTETLAMGWVKLLIWLGLAALIYHLTAGVRHILMDVGIGESLAVARKSAWATFIVAAVLIIAIGIWLW